MGSRGRVSGKLLLPLGERIRHFNDAGWNKTPIRARQILPLQRPQMPNARNLPRARLAQSTDVGRTCGRLPGTRELQLLAEAAPMGTSGAASRRAGRPTTLSAFAKGRAAARVVAPKRPLDKRAMWL